MCGKAMLFRNDPIKIFEALPPGCGEAATLKGAIRKSIAFPHIDR